jgi:hypothetical protein
MAWNLEGLRVRGTFLDSFPVEGRVELSRVTYGGKVAHTVVLDSPIQVFGALRERVILSQGEIQQVSSNRVMTA